MTISTFFPSILLCLFTFLTVVAIVRRRQAPRAAPWAIAGLLAMAAGALAQILIGVFGREVWEWLAYHMRNGEWTFSVITAPGMIAWGIGSVLLFVATFKGRAGGDPAPSAAAETAGGGAAAQGICVPPPLAQALVPPAVPVRSPATVLPPSAPVSATAVASSPTPTVVVDRPADPMDFALAAMQAGDAEEQICGVLKGHYRLDDGKARAFVRIARVTQVVKAKALPMLQQGLTKDQTLAAIKDEGAIPPEDFEIFAAMLDGMSQGVQSAVRQSVQSGVADAIAEFRRKKR